MHCDLLGQRVTPSPLRQRTLPLLQQRSNESAFFGQKRFRADEARVVSGAVVIAIGGENRCAHRERAPARLSIGHYRAGLAMAISDVLGKENPRLDIAGDATHATLLVPLEALLTRKAQNVTTATSGGFLIANDIGRQIEFASRSFVRLDHAISQLSSRVVHCGEHRLNAASFSSFPAPTVRFDFD